MVQELAGHPIAIRVGGRRQSHSNPIRSPNKNGSASTSPESPTTLSGQAPIPTGLSDDYPRPQGARTDAAADVSPPPNIEGGADVKHDDAHGDGYQDEEDDEGRKERKKKSLKGEQARQLQKEHTSHTAHRKVSTGAPRNIITQPAQKMAM